VLTARSEEALADISRQIGQAGGRAGVVYGPQHEAFGNYVPTVMPKRYDALAFIDESHALHPLYMRASLDHEVPEMFPTGI
jgi:hypothetical protein